MLFEQLKNSAKSLRWEDHDLQELSLLPAVFKTCVTLNSNFKLSHTYNKELGISFIVKQKIQNLYLMLQTEV